MPAMYPVSSSMIKAVGYEDDEVFVQFRNGSVYVYPGTEADVNFMRAAESAGKFFNENIKPRTNRKIS